MAFDGTNAYLQSSSNQDIIGSSNFTMECWLYATSIPSGVANMIVGTNGWHWSIVPSGSGYVMDLFNLSTDVVSTTVCNFNTWYYLAVVRNGTTVTYYVNGVASNSFTMALPASSIVQIGHANRYTPYYMAGYIDDLRITKGVARYTANFTPPSSAFPNL
jgi:hypothetical protein